MSIDPSENGELSQDNPEAMAENKAAQTTSMHLYFPCGIIRGALSNLGIPCAVSADMSNLPACESLALECFNFDTFQCTSSYIYKHPIMNYFLFSGLLSCCCGLRLSSFIFSLFTKKSFHIFSIILKFSLPLFFYCVIVCSFCSA